MRGVLFLLITVLSLCLKSQSVWTRKVDFAGQNRVYHVDFVIDGKCYMGTGKYLYDSHECLNDFWEWDAITNTWTQKANFPVPLANAVTFAIGGKGYIVTGMDSYQSYSGLWEYDPANNTWSGKSPFPGPARGNAVCFTIGTKAYLGLGSTYQANVLQDLWEWDQSTNGWTQKANFPGGPRINAIAFSIGNKGYFGAGADAYSFKKDFWEWDQTTNTWTRMADFPLAKMYLSAFAIGSNGYAGISCCDATSQYIDTSKFWTWNRTTNVWTETEPFTGVPAGNIGFANGSKGYIGMGGGMSGQEFWEFDPTSTAGIKETTHASSLNVFPNPTSSSLTIDFVSPRSDIRSISVKNSLGEVVCAYVERNCSGIFHQSLNQLPKGLYFIEFTLEGYRQVRKVIVQ